jgi:hypothetical protein
VNSIITLQENNIMHCNNNTCHNSNIKMIITILQKYYTGLHKFTGIETKFEFKFKLNLNCKRIKQKIKETVTVVSQFP